MEIFEFVYTKDPSIKDWIYSADEEDAIEFYAALSGDDEETIKERHSIKKIPPIEWKNYSVFYPDTWNPEREEYDKTETFEKWASKNNNRDIIATTEF